MTKAQIAIRGTGIATAYGSGVAATRAGLAAGAAARQLAGDIGYPGSPPLVHRWPRDRYAASEAGAKAVLLDVVREACDAAALPRAALQSPRTALIVGSGGFLYASGAELFRRRTGLASTETPFAVRGPDWGAACIASHFGMTGRIMTLTTSCASSANALLVAIEWLQRETVDCAVVVGVEGISAVTLSGFAGLMLLDAKGCRPFDRDREGLMLGDGAAALVLERATSSSATCTLTGGANLCDTHHLTSASPDGERMRHVMQAALSAAGHTANDVALVKAHGVGSLDSDTAEARALRALFADRLPPVVGLKGSFGHTLGACGAVETVALADMLDHGFIPPTAGFVTVDPELNLAPTTDALARPSGPVLMNFFGFGGSYTSLIMLVQ